MSEEAIRAVVERTHQDGYFYQFLQADPTAALAGDELTQEERLALQQRDRAALLALGVPLEWAEWWGV